MTKRSNGSPWTEERLSAACGLLSQGYSLNQTAEEMGITRRALTEGLRRAGRLPDKRWVFKGENTTDLVERLRDVGDHARFVPHLHHEAADQIERLQNDVQGLRDAIEDMLQYMIPDWGRKLRIGTIYRLGTWDWELPSARSKEEE